MRRTEPRGLAALRTACLAGAALMAGVLPAAAQTGPALFPIRSGERHGLIDAAGRVVLAAEYDEVKPGDPLILARRGARTAYADATGRLVVASA